MMMQQSKKIKDVPEPTLKRLPGYLHYLQRTREQGIMSVSAPLIGADLSLDPTQVVKDLAVTGVKGKPRVGYNTYELIQAIEDFLGFNKPNEAFLFGAGNLGSALLAYPELLEFGIKILAAFDVNPNIVGTTKGSVNVLHLDKFPDLGKRLRVEIGILTTPAKVSQEVVNLMISNGIRAIWNFSPTKITTPENIVVQNTSMYSNAAVLLKKLHNLKEDDSLQ